ncbi:MAG: hypothetical protein AB7G11_02285 [Phycisphaerales bacterium]
MTDLQTSDLTYTHRQRDLLAERWTALLDACHRVHEELDAPGGHARCICGQAMCICGSDCGGHAACSMARELRDLVHLLPRKRLPKAWRDKLELLRSVM